MVHIYTEYYSAIKRNAFELVLVSWMNLEPVTQHGISQKKKNEYRILTHIYEIYWASLVAQRLKHLPGIWRPGFDPWVGKIPWRRKWQHTPVFLPGKSHGWGSLVGCRLWGRTESDTTECFHFHFSLSCLGEGNGTPLLYSCLENPRDGEAW